MACRVPSGRVPKTCTPSDIRGRPSARVLRSPEIESANMEGLPLITIGGIAFSALLATSDSIVGSSDDSACSHCPSTDSIELPPTKPRLVMAGSLDTEYYRHCQSTIKGS